MISNIEADQLPIEGSDERNRMPQQMSKCLRASCQHKLLQIMGSEEQVLLPKARNGLDFYALAIRNRPPFYTRVHYVVCRKVSEETRVGTVGASLQLCRRGATVLFFIVHVIVAWASAEGYIYHVWCDLQLSVCQCAEEVPRTSSISLKPLKRED